MSMSASAPAFLPQNFRPFAEQIALVRRTVAAKGKVLLLLRGLPGSGKTTLGNVIISSLGHGKMFCADDYFVYNGQYYFRPNELEMAHNACQSSVAEAMKSSEGLVIVANTNIEKWQMTPYAAMASKHGYYLLLMEPNTPWKKDACQLARLNVHGVKKKKIFNLMDRFQAVQASDLMSQEPLEHSLPPVEPCAAAQSSSGPSDIMTTIPKDATKTPESKGKPKTKAMTKREISDMFREVRISTELGQWPSDVISGKTRATTRKAPPASTAQTRDATTTISELDQVFFEEEDWSSLALDLGYRLVLSRGTWNAQASGNSSTTFKDILSSHVSRATQTVHEEQVNTDASSDGLATLCAIFPHAQPSDLAELLRVTNGDVDWAVDIFLQSGYADGVPCERPTPAADPSSGLDWTTSVDPSSSSASSSGSLPRASSARELEAGRQPGSSTEEIAPCLSLSLQFLRAAHRRFSAEFETECVDIDGLPEALYQQWELPCGLARAIYASFLEHLGQIESAEAHTACEAFQAFDLKKMQPDVISNAPTGGVREIIEEEEMMEKINADKRKDLQADTASMLKFGRLAKTFPNMERQELMDIFISFQHREDWTRAHLLSLGHVTSQGERAEAAVGDDVAAEEETHHQSKVELLAERARLTRKKIHLQEQLRKVAGQHNLMAAAGYYVGELYQVDASLTALSERLRAARVAEQEADMLDLHHFTVTEAINSLKQRMAERWAAGATSRRRQLLVLTGVGRHSRGKPKLRPAVRQFLQQSGLRFEEIYQGTFRVTV